MKDFMRGLLSFFIQTAGHVITSENNERKHNRFIIRLRYLSTLYRKHRRREETERDVAARAQLIRGVLRYCADSVVCGF